MKRFLRRVPPGLKAALAVWALAAGACGRPGGPAAVWREPVTGMELVYLPAGHFRMGTALGEVPRQPDEVPHEVTLSHGFYLGRYEVTQEEWRRVMGGIGGNPSRFAACGPRCPVETVSYDDIRRFLRRLSALSPGERYRLPSEAEWEYACRAGTATAFATGANLTAEQANYDGRYPLPPGPVGRYLARPAPAGSYAPNPWGLYDLHGNVWEWVEDWYGDYPAGPAVDPRGPAREGGRRVWDARGGDWERKKVIRGGSWYFNAESCRCALRYTHAPADSGFSLGFRLVRDLPNSPVR